LRLTDKRISALLYATQGVGIIFIAFFLAAYLGGLPSTNVLHSEPAFRIPLTILGVVLLFLFLFAIVIFAFSKKNR
jgi:Zn-dependent protease with chaperone function